MPVFYSYGNHEQRAKNNVKKYGSLFEDYQKALENINVELLDNCKIEYDGINIFAFSLPGKYYLQVSLSRIMARANATHKTFFI